MQFTDNLTARNKSNYVRTTGNAGGRGAGYAFVGRAVSLPLWGGGARFAVFAAAAGTQSSRGAGGGRKGCREGGGGGGGGVGSVRIGPYAFDAQGVRRFLLTRDRPPRREIYSI